MGKHFRNPYEHEAAASARRDGGEDTAFDPAEEGTRNIEIQEEGDDGVQEPAAEESGSTPTDQEADAAPDPVTAFEGEATFPGGLFSQQPAAEVEAIRAEMENLRLRQAAEMDNFKKRLNREHEEQLQYAAEKVLGDLLPTLDNLELALQYGTTNEACKDLLQGVSMTHKLLLDAVQKHGLTPLGNVGEAFDPAIHEAVGVDAESDAAPGSVSRVLQKGYKLGNRLLRPARVMISQ